MMTQCFNWLLLETNCIRQLEMKQAHIILSIVLQILTAEQGRARKTWATNKGMGISLICSCSAGVPMIVSEMIWARCLAGCLMQLVSNTKVNHSLLSLSATRVTTLWLKQPICFYSVGMIAKKETFSVYI